MGTLEAEIISREPWKSSHFAHVSVSSSWLRTQPLAYIQVLGQHTVSFDQRITLALVQFKMLPRLFDVSELEVINRELQLIGKTHVTVGRNTAAVRIAGPHNVVNRVFILQERCDAFQPVRELSRNWVQINATA